MASGVGALSGVNGFTSSQSATGARGTSPLKVSIEGTGVASTVDGTGQFTLTGVPPGTVVLKFSGPGVEASLTISGVREGDQIQIKVTLESSRARVESESRQRRDEDDRDRDDGDNDDKDDGRDDDGGLEVRGTVSALSGVCPALTFVVGERRVTTSTSTTFGTKLCSGVRNMVRVEVQGQLRPDGTVAASRVSIAD
jgi:hypothetical protein